MQSGALGIGALPGRDGHQHGAELLAISLTMSLAVERSPIVLVLDILGAKRNFTSHFSLVWYGNLLSIPKFGETGDCLEEERKEKNPTLQPFPCAS